MTLRAKITKKTFFYYNQARIIVRSKHVWTNGNIVKSPYKDVVVPEVTLMEYVWRDLNKWATKPAVLCGVTNRSYTYEEIYKQSRVLAANLRKKFKIRDGDVVGVMASNIPEYPTVTFGILQAGGIVTTLNPLYTEYEVQRQLEISNVKIMIAAEDAVPVVKKALQLSKMNIPIITIKVNKPLPENVVSFKELVDDNHIDLKILNEVNRKPSDLAILPYSSGTTGLPKGVELTNRNFVANCEQQNTELRQYYDTTESHQDVVLTILPLFHAYGLSILMLHKLSVGLKLLTLPKFQPDTFVDALKIHRANLLYVVPPMVLFLGSNQLVTSDHLASVRRITSGAAPLPPADVEKVLAKTKGKKNIELNQGYGMTEASPLVTLSPPGCKDYVTVGYALPNVQLRVIDKDMKSLGPGEVGELLIKGPNVMKGYRNNPTANKEVFVDGWYRSGDIANIDESGFVYITDRLKELIKVKGYQVPPAELENVLKSHPAVHDAAVVGIPDVTSGERPKAFVVLMEGAAVTDKEIMEYVAKRVAPYKKIKEIVFLDSIPKSVSGKILRKNLQ